jgi:hypothetical protein
MEDRKHPTPTKARVRKDLSADALFGALHPCFDRVVDPSRGTPEISLHDILMSGFAVFSLKASSLLAFDRIRIAENHNLRSIYHIKDIPCDTQMRTRLDEVDPDDLRPAYRAVFRRAQRGKALEEMVFMNDCYLVSLDGTGYFSSDQLYSPACLEKVSSKTGKITFYLQTLGAVIVCPGRREVIPLPPEPIRKQDGATKNDCERNACRRWLTKFRKDHPHLKVIVVEDGLSPNGPHIRDLKAHRCHFILGVKEQDHQYLFSHLDAAVENGLALTHDMPDDTEPGVRHFFRFVNDVPLNESNQDIRVNLLEYWEVRDNGKKYFSWVTDFTLTEENVYLIMRGGRARWKVENETFNTLKNQGYNLEHNYGLGKKHLSMNFVSLMMLAFLVDQVQQLSCALFREVWKKVGSKKELWEKIRGAFHFFALDSMEMLYRLILAGPHQVRPVFLEDTS